MIRRFVFFFIAGFLLLGVAAGAAVLKRSHKPPKPAPTVQAEDTQVTLIEGWDNQDIANFLEQKNIVPAQAFLSALKDFDTSNFPLANERPKGAGLEGYIFPDTYRIPKLQGNAATATKAVSDALIRKALQNFENKFTDQMKQRAQELHMTVYEVVTLASIVEKETGRNVTTQQQKQQLDAERAIVAGIFYNRMNAGMPLESDATVNYITGKQDPSATIEDTKIDSPYNTYKYKGLPPGPIANPSLSSLKAVLYPTKTDYYYFLHKQPSGEAVYSKTYEEHLQNKYRYLK